MTEEIGRRAFLKKMCQGSKGVWLIVGILFLISLVAVYSSLESVPGYNYVGQYSNHIMVSTGAVVLMLIVHRLPPKVIMSLLLFGFVFSFLLVLICPFFGTLVNGARRTILGVQPSEWIKPCLIVYTAMSLAGGMKLKNEGKEWSWAKGNLFGIIPPKWLWVVVCSVICLMIGLENGSQAVIIALVLLFMVVLAGVPFKHIFAYFGILLIPVGVVLAIFFVQLDSKGNSTTPTFKKGMLHRVDTWYHRIQNMGTEKNPHDENFDFSQDEQANHAKVAVARSKGIGCGIVGSAERSVLPLAFSDLIFASIIEMYGFFGFFVIFLLYASFFIITIRWGLKTESCSYSLILFGCGAVITIQALVNMLVGAGFFVTGQPLPFVSKGGQSMLVCAIIVALVQSIIKKEMAKRELKKAKQNVVTVEA